MLRKLKPKVQSDFGRLFPRYALHCVNKQFLWSRFFTARQLTQMNKSCMNSNIQQQHKFL